MLDCGRYRMGHLYEKKTQKANAVNNEELYQVGGDSEVLDQEEGVKVSGTEVRAGRAPATSALRVCMAGQ